MSFPSAFTQQIKQRYILSDWISKTVAIKRKGKEFLGLCPFHHEKTPSFTVNDEKQFYHCFGCGAHGSIVDFVMETEGRNYQEAVRYLADLAGIEVPKDERRFVAQQQENQKLYDVCAHAMQWFSYQLTLSSAAEVNDYLQNRGMSKDLCQEFDIGFAPPHRFGLKDEMMKKGFDEKTLIDAGLLIKVEEKPSYDRFRNRLMFPIKNHEGRIVAFGGRSLDGMGAKYINSPESIIFKKGEILYRFHDARKAAYRTKKFVVVEGYMDVIAMYRAGINAAVAPMGTAMTEMHLQILWQHVKEPAICFDGDAAGKKAAHAIAMKALPLLKPGCSLQFVFLPSGEDPDSFLNAQGAVALQKHVDSSIPLSEVIWRYALEYFSHDTPEQQAGFRAQVLSLVNMIAEESVRRPYRSFMESKLWHLLSTKQRLYARSRASLPTSTELSLPEYSVLEAIEKKILAFALLYPHIVVKNETIHGDFVEHIHLQGESHRLIYERMIDFISQCERIDHDILKKHLEKCGFNNDIEVLCGRNSIYVDHVSTHDEALLELLWKCTMKQYYIAHMQLERQMALLDASTEAVEKAGWLHSQILEYEKELSLIKQNLELNTEL